MPGKNVLMYNVYPHPEIGLDLKVCFDRNWFDVSNTGLNNHIIAQDEGSKERGDFVRQY